MKISIIKVTSLIGLSLVLLTTACKTTEANYKTAYEKAIASREDDEREIIYGGASRKPDRRVIVERGDTAEIMIKPVTPVKADGTNTPQVKKIMLVAGEFKQLFNAQSMCKRLAENGYPDALVVQTAEPYYYIVADSFDSIAEAKNALGDIANNAPFPLKSPAPFLLRDPRK